MMLMHSFSFFREYFKYIFSNFFVILIWGFFGHHILAQNISTDTTQYLEETTITATRHLTEADKIAVPIQIITQKMIQQTGSMRLGDILSEQTGIQLTQDHAQGVQLQGLSADYTLILLNGEPLIGRTAGSLDLSRISVGNILRIEVIKGASSALYGSEALAGVINIITEENTNKTLNIQSRYGKNQIFDTQINASTQIKDFSIKTFFNHYRNGGYDFTPAIFGATIEPHFNNTFQNNLAYKKQNLEIKLQTRFFEETQQQGFLVDADEIVGKGNIKDQNHTLGIKWKNSGNQFQIQAKTYFSKYQAITDLRYNKNQNLYENTFFIQTFLRPEIQAEYFGLKNHYLIMGLGNAWESVEATRYTAKKFFQNQYAFLQHEWDITNKMQANIGVRFDAHSNYQSQLSPKFSFLYRPTSKYTLRMSVSKGFKAPDFRQLYLDFANSVVGYSVYGTEEIQQALIKLQAQGQISEVLASNENASKLNPERSTSWQIGGNAQIHKNWRIKYNFFYNQITDLIETQAVARKINGQFVYSYKNIQSIFSKGFEIEQDFSFFKNLKFSLGYQYLIAKDNDIAQKVKNGEIYRRNPQTLLTEKVKTQEYGGLFNRSKHTANLKIWYEIPKYNTSVALRFIYKGRYGWGDANGNLILDIDEEYIKGYVLTNLTLKKIFAQKYTLQMGCDNLFDFRNESQIPNLQGRWYWVGFNLQIL